MHVIARLTKVDEEKRLVYGRIAEEAPDKSGELMDYATSKPYFAKWSEDVARDSGGKSLGNVRAMHGKVAAGKLTGIDFNDAEKAIDVCAKVVDDAEWSKVMEGVYTGFSIGGSYVAGSRKVEKSADGASVTRYTAQPSEVSLVDRPCMPGARFFDVQKADGSLVKAEFAPAAKDDAKDGEEEKDDEAKADDKEGAEAKDGKAKGGADDEAKKAQQPGDLEVKGSAEDVLALGKAMNDSGLAVADLLAMLAERKAAAAVAKAAEPGALRKSLYSCAAFIQAISALVDLMGSVEFEALYEGDPEDRAIADELRACVAMCGATVQRMLAHELGELAGTEAADAGTVELAEKAGALAKAEGDAPADPLMDLLKIGARNSKNDAGRLAKIHDLINELGHPCAAQKAAPEGDLAKTEGLAVARLEPLQKALDSALCRLAKLEAQPAVPTIRLRAVEKAQDVATPGQATAEAPEPVRDGMGKEHDAATLIKAMHASGGQALMKTR